ncbi:hypothetical protein MBLNU13_g10896t1 [Cladosporium sp. NU13]
MTTSIKITSSSGPSYIPQTASLYKTAFRTDPGITYVLGALPESARHAYLEEYFTRITTAAALNAAEFSEAEAFSSVSIVIPPGKTVDNPRTLIPAGIFQVLWKLGFSGCWRMLREFEPATKRGKVGADGLEKVGGEGVPIYCMIWWPEKKEKEKDLLV